MVSIGRVLCSFVIVTAGLLTACAEQYHHPTVKEQPVRVIPPHYEQEVAELNARVEEFHDSMLPQITPEHAKVHVRLGVIYYEIEEMNEAEYNLDRSLQMVTGDAEARLYLGRVFRKTGRHRKAIEEFKLVLQIDPTMVEAHKELGDLYQAVGMVREAEAEFRLYENVQSAPSP